VGAPQREEIGFKPPEEEGYQGHFLSDTALQADGTLWVSDCIGMGEALSGQGIRSFNGKKWQALAGAESLCIFDMEMDRQGRTWVGTFDKVIRYDPGMKEWTGFPLPEYERRQLVARLDLDPDGNPWIGVLRQGGASMYGSTELMYLEGDAWEIVEEASGYSPGSVAFRPDGEAWWCGENSLLSIQGGSAHVALEQVNTSCRVQVDGRGVPWAAFPGMGEDSLWRGVP